jgi:hypothetical protein
MVQLRMIKEDPGEEYTEENGKETMVTPLCASEKWLQKIS